MLNKSNLKQRNDNVNSDVDMLEKYFAIAEEVKVIIDPQEAKEYLSNLPKFIALDFETTALSPKIGEVRLSCFYDGDRAIIIDHFHCIPFKDLLESFSIDTTYVVYNAKFETDWIDYFSNSEFDILDVDFMAKVKLGGHPSSLARMAKRDLNVDLSKTLQTSDWSAPKLDKEQYTYGALDAVITWALFTYWDSELPDEQWDSVDIFNDAVRATIEAEQTGLLLDSAVHLQNVKKWQMKQELVLRRVRHYTPKSMIDNLNSTKQINDFLRSQLDVQSLINWPKTGKRKELSQDQKVLRPIAAKAPYPFSRWLNALIQYKYYSKYLSTYGEKLITIQNMKGKVTSRFNIAQAATGRYSSSNTNLQNIPRKVYVRKAFYAGATALGLIMCLADYSGIEVRVLAEISGDELLLRETIYGNVHARSASVIYNLDYDYIIEVLDNPSHPKYYTIKELRTRAKNFTFQLLYGAGAAALSIALKCTVEEAVDAVKAWAATYSKAYNYRHVIFEQMNQTGFIPVIDGRTIYVRKPDRTIPVASNYGIQGAAASVMYRAMYHVHNNFVDYRNGDLDTCRIAATVHDELLSYAKVDHAEKVMELQIEGMRQGWLDIFPDTSTENLIEHAIGDTWAAKP